MAAREGIWVWAGPVPGDEIHPWYGKGIPPHSSPFDHRTSTTRTTTSTKSKIYFVNLLLFEFRFAQFFGDRRILANSVEELVLLLPRVL